MPKLLFCLFVLFVVTGYNATAQGGDSVTHKSKHLDKPKLSGIPIINYNPSYGFELGALAILNYSLSKKDTISPASMSSLGGMYTTNKSWFAFSFSSLYFNKDRYRVVVGGGFGEQNFQFFMEDYPGGGTFVNYNTLSGLFFFRPQVRVWKRLFVGLQYIYLNTKTEFADGKFSDGRNGYSGLGLALTYDTRENVYNPSKGFYTNITSTSFGKALGSDSNYTKLKGDFNYYYPLTKKGIIAARFTTDLGLGQTPFESQTVVGGKDIRGYSNGKYRSDQVYTTQAEYRWNFYNKLGAVFFGGLATAMPTDRNWEVSDLLPAIGTGIRYQAVKALKANVGMDIAVGKDDWGIYFRFGEAF